MQALTDKYKNFLKEQNMNPEEFLFVGITRDDYIFYHKPKKIKWSIRR